MLTQLRLPRKAKCFTWGRNKYGQLGHGDKKDRHIPTKVESLDGLVIVKIACGYYHTVAITDVGDTYTWYVNQRIPQLVQFVIAISNILKIFNRGLVHFHGDNEQLGSVHGEDTPKKVEALAGEVIVDVACGKMPYTCRYLHRINTHVWKGWVWK